MKIKPVSYDKKTGKACFLIEGTDVSVANALRRAATDEVPVMAIEDVEFRKNSSALYDEIIAHRLGLITLTTDLQSYVMPKDCKCGGEGCARCTVKLTLKEGSQGMVKASEIESSDPNVKPKYPDTPIALLLKGQKLEFEATAVLGQGKEHMKWSPGLAYYKQKPEITIDAGKVKNPEDVAAHCPKKAFEAKNGKITVNEENLYACDLCGECEAITEGAIKIKENPNSFVFYAESWGQLDPKEMVTEAAKLLEEKAEEFEKKIKE